MARISVADLFTLIEAGAAPLIIDVRSATAHALDARTIPGALRIALSDAKEHLAQLPRDRDVVLFCNCPNDATAAKTAMTLHKLGIERVRPLRGGYDEWKRLGFPLAAVAAASPAQSS